MTAAPQRLKRRRDFLRVQAAGRKAAMPGLVLQAAPRESGAGIGLGFTVSRRVGNAVTRNRLRRRLKAVAAEVMAEGAADADYVIIGRAGGVDRPYDALRRDLIAALKRLKHWTAPDGATARRNIG